MLGARVVARELVQSGGYSRVNAHWRVTLADGRTAFVKHAQTDDAAEWLRKERVVYESVRGPFMPSYLGAHDARGTTLLVLEDLVAARWPPPWSLHDIDAVLASLAALHATPPPAGIASLEGQREQLVGIALR